VLVIKQTTEGPEITGAAGAAPTVTSTTNGAPTHPAGEVGVTVYSTTPCTLPKLVNTSAMVVPQLEEQLPLPITPPTITAEVHVKLLPDMFEFKGTLLGSPLHITMLAAEPTGPALTVTVCVAVAVLPLLSVTVHVTVVVPVGYVEGALLVTDATPQLSAVVGVPKLTVPPLHTVTAAGAVMVGDCVSLTVTIKVDVAVLPAASVATQVTVVGPVINVLPDAGVQTTELTEQLSVAVGEANVTTAPQTPASLLTVMFELVAMVGFWLSVTFTICVHDAVFPPPSVTVQVMVLLPNEYGPAGLCVTVVLVPVTDGEPIDALLVHVPASLFKFAVAGQVIVGNAFTVTSITTSAPTQPFCVAELIVYSTTASTVPVFISTSAIVFPQPPRQSKLPDAAPLITTCDQVISVFATVDVIATFAAAPLNIVVLAADTTGVAPTVAMYVNALPVHPAAVGIIE
jgi:hypothetical protein